jgi:TP901 family phage tail tape measure protein
VAKFVLTAQLQLQAPNNVASVVNKIQQQLRGVTVNVEAKGAVKTQREIQKLTQDTDNAATSAKRMGSAFEVSFRRFTALALATRTITLFTNSLTNSVKEAVAFERELLKISQVTGKTMSDLRGLTDTITNLSTSFGVSSSSLLGVSRILSQAGFDAKQTEIALSTLAKTELAPTFDNITQTAEGAVAIFNQFRKGAEALEAQLGAINAVAGKFAVEAGDLISVLRRTGGVFQASGGDLNELIALFTSVRATTRESAESIATGLRTIFTRIQRPRTIEYLKQFGVELVDLEGKFIGPFEATRRLSQALAGLEQGDITFIKIAEELGGFRQIGKVIPLLQQFSVAQEALNVAQEGSGSLALDAAAAQQTLAVRIDKVREEFTALIRSISETRSFQIMANTALALAEGLIKVGEAIRPIIPLLGALAAFKLTKGLAGFTGNVARNIQGFNSGGLVPGTGNRDTVPAMLTPGEFVIRKSSVAQLGAGNLAAMNANRYASGGLVSSQRHAYGPDSLVDELINEPPEKSLIGDKRFSRLTRQQVKFVNSQRALIASKPIAAASQGVKGKEPLVDENNKPYTFGLASLYGPRGNTAPTRTELPITKEVVNTQYGILDKKISDKYEVQIRQSVKNVSGKFAKELAGDIKDGTPIKGKALNDLIDKAGFANAVGAFFETALALTGAPYEGKSQINDSIDFAQGLGEVSSKFNLPSDIPTDATRTSGSKGKSRRKFAAQVERYMLKQGLIQAPQKLATGGAVGTDTVPALLTPGEFVVNKKSAQAIGYGSLNRMNKIGKYAKGGVVQRFEDGGGVRGGLGYPGSMPTQTQQQIDTTLAQKSIDKASRYFAGAGAAAFAVTTALNSMLPAVQENEGASLRLTRALSDSVMTTVGSFGTLGYALSNLGEKFQIGNLIKGKFTGPLVAAGASAMLTSSALEALYDSANQYNKALKEGNVAEAERLSTRASTAGARSTVATGLGLAAGGGFALAFTNPVTAAIAGIGAAAVAATALTVGLEAGADTFQNFLSNFGYATADQVKAQTASRIATQNFTKALQEASERADSAFQEAKVSGDFSGAGERAFEPLVKSISEQIKTVNTVIKENQKTVGPSFFTLENVGSQIDRLRKGDVASSDFFEDASNFSSVEKANSLLKKELESAGLKAGEVSSFLVSLKDPISELVDLYQSQAKAIKASTQFINQSFRSAAIGGQFSSGFSQTLLKSRDIAQRNLQQEDLGLGRILEQTQEQDRERLLSETRTSLENTVKNSTTALVNNLNSVVQSSDQLSPSLKKLITSLPTEQALELARGLTNIGSEIERLKKRFELINLGLSPFNANVVASNVALKNYLSAVDGSSTQLERSFNTLSAALSSTGSNISDSDFESSLESVSKTLKEYGATQKTISETQKKLQAGRATQNILADYISELEPTNFEDLKSTGSLQAAQEKIAKTLSDKLGGMDVDKTVASQIVSSFRDNPPSEALTKAFEQGDISGFQNALGEISSEFINQLAPSIKQVVESEKDLNKALQKRIDAENKLYAAQTQALSIEMEAAQIQSQYGGKFVTSADKLANLTAKMNVGLVASLPKVNASLDGFANRIKNIEATSAILSEQEAAGEGELQSRDAQKRLAEITNETVAQARALIDIRKQEYEIIKRKSQLEKDSLDSLISGDVESFFKKQAAEGAVGAVALGRGDLATQFGGGALAEGVSFLKGLRDAGIDEFQGQKISGPGGLEERTRIAALTARGVDSNLAVRGAQLGSETTPELNAAASNIRQAAQILIDAGTLQQRLAQNQVIEAQDVYINAKNAVDQNIDRSLQTEEQKNRKALENYNEMRKMEQRDRLQKETPLRHKVTYPKRTDQPAPRYDFRFDATDLSAVNNSMNTFSQSVEKFVNFNPTLKLDTTNMVVTLNANQLLQNMPQFILDNVKPLIHEAIENATVGPNGKLKPGTGSTLS